MANGVGTRGAAAARDEPVKDVVGTAVPRSTR